MRVFSWLGLAPAVANVIGPVVAGAAIDLGGYGLAFALMAALPLASLLLARMVPPTTDRPAPVLDASVSAPRRRPLLASARELLMRPGMRRLLLVNWLVSASWDVHAFLVPVLGHERGLSASAIGAVLGVFAAAVALVRLAIPLVAHRLTEMQSLRAAMWVTAGVFATYPFAGAAWSMAACAAVLGLALGTVQPMIMSTLHRLTPEDRHGEALALRSMTINAASTAMPLVFGVAGSAVGATALFWGMASALGAGTSLTRRLAHQLASTSAGDRTRPGHDA
jgi:predicted MFS family arabinose efflux permease